ncbi:MAG: flagellar hook basal-body protein [Deltaproteobacteria bacterium]|nr:flagellar hook basal-body protein [Deltaproteobacteria bacterium]MBW2068293.1 flagellar hook basal-body protein [Deltaproteobacteria bacterium]
MKLGYYAPALGAILEEKRLDVIANNIANANTPGFKKENARFTDFLFEETHTIFDQGTIRTTSSPLDLAIIGKGFFKVKTDKGILYTRAGNLMLDSEGRLITPEGWPVLGKNGEITLRSPDVIINEKGEILEEDGTIVDTLDVATFDSLDKLQKIGKNYFKPLSPNLSPKEATEYKIQQGALEEPNLNVVEEMTKLIDTLRTFEAHQKVMKTFHDEDRQLIRKASGR